MNDAKNLLAGYATDGLDDVERRRLAEAALADQDVFDELMEEETWRQVLRRDDVRRELLAVLRPPSPWGDRGGATLFPWQRWMRPVLAAGAVAAVALSFVLLRPPAAEPPPPVPDGTRGLTPKSLDGSTVSPENVPPENVPPLDLFYSFERRTPSGDSAPVAVDHVFVGGEQLRVRLAGEGEVSVYLFARSAGEDTWGVLYPARESERRPRRLTEDGFALPWLVMDPTPEDEDLVLVVTTSAWTALEAGQNEVAATTLDPLLRSAEERLQTFGWRRSVLEDRVRLQVADPADDMVLVIPLMQARPAGGRR